MTDDPNSRTACEVTAVAGRILLFGEILSNTLVDCAKIARAVVRRIGYTSSGTGFDADIYSILSAMVGSTLVILFAV